MNRIALIAALVAGTASLMGCSANSTSIGSKDTAATGTAKGAMTVTGSVSSKLGTDNARAVAIGSNGKQIWTYLDSHGDFTLKLPVGTSYRVVIANQLTSGDAQKVIGKVAVPTKDANTQWIKADKVTSMDLGILRKPDSATAATATSIKTHSLKISCGCSDDESGGDWGGGSDSGDWGGGSSGSGDWGGGSSDTGSWGGGGGSDSGDWGGGGGDYSGGDWGDGFCDDGFGGGYGSDDGGWDDSASGWDDGEGDSDPGNHGDDNPCFGGGDDDDDSGWGDWSSFGIGTDSGDPGAICDVCSGGADAVILAPSNSECGAFGDTSISENNFPETKTCPLQTGTTTTTASASSSGSIDTSKSLAGSTGSAASSQGIGGSCSVKAQCGTGNSCVAGKCAAN